MGIAEVQKRIYRIVERSERGDLTGRAFDVVVMGLVVLNAVSVVLETVPSIAAEHALLFDVIESFCVSVFTLELALRLFAAGADPRFAGFRGRLRFLVSPLVIVDIIAIAPFFLPMIVETDARALQSLRLLRLLRLLKMGRYLESMRMLARVARQRREQLLGALLVVILLLIISATLMYSVEHDAQPQVFSSIPMSMWWAIATLTTVGYGDIYPVTGLGRVLASLIAVLGVGMFALPAGIIGSGLADELARKREAKVERPRACPHCGGALGDEGPEEEAPDSARTGQ